MILNDLQITGWDIGGVNIKAVRLGLEYGKIREIQTVVRPFEIWQDLYSLPAVLRDIGEELGLQGFQRVAVTMTAELSDVFSTKREGVLFVLNAIGQVFEKSFIYPFNLDGRFFHMDEAKQNPLLCAATNWLASALFVAGHHPDCILMDIGSTTTDIIPIRGGKVISKGRTDTERLISGELVYTGILRTNPNTVADQAPATGQLCRFAAEYFTSMADVYLILGQILPYEYTCSTADRKAKTIPEAQSRLARLVCSDSEGISGKKIYMLAHYLREKQLQQIMDAIFQVLSRLEDAIGLPLAMAGTGRFLAKELARRLGVPAIDLGHEWGDSALASFPALAVANLLAERLTEGIV